MPRDFEIRCYSRPEFAPKAGFSSDFPGPNLTMWENMGPKSFQNALILNELKIICMVLKGIYTSLVEGGGVSRSRYKPGG
jgi:hypothetical protein